MSNTSTERETIVGVFHHPERARDAIEALKDAGFRSNEIGVLMQDKERAGGMARETGIHGHAGEGAAAGAVAGGILGSVGGWLAGVGALAIPGVGPLITAGAFASALGGAAIGAGVGAIAGALVGLGVPKEEAEYYEGEVRSGRTLVTVTTPGRHDEAQRILRDYDAYDIESRERAAAGDGYTTGATGRATGATAGATGYTETGHPGRRAGEGDTLKLREEELHARKQSVEAGQGARRPPGPPA